MKKILLLLSVLALSSCSAPQDVREEADSAAFVDSCREVGGSVEMADDVYCTLDYNGDGAVDSSEYCSYGDFAAGTCSLERAEVQFKKTAPTIVLSTESGAGLYPIQGSSCIYPKSGKGYVSCSDVPSVDNALLTYQSFNPANTVTAHFDVDYFGDEISDLSINAYDLDHDALEKNISYTQLDADTYQIDSGFDYGSDARFILSFFVKFSSGSDVSYYFPLRTSSVTSAEDLGVLCTGYDGSSYYSSDLDEMRFYDYKKLVPEESDGGLWYSYPALGLKFQYEGSQSIYERINLYDEDSYMLPSLLFSFQDQVECVGESIDNSSTDIYSRTQEGVADLKAGLHADGALEEETVTYGGNSYGHIRGHNLGNGIADFYFKEQGAKTYIFTFTWLHEGEDGKTMQEIGEGRNTDPLPEEYQTVLETLEFL